MIRAFMLGTGAALGVYLLGEWMAAIVMANAYGTGLSPSAEPVPVSSASPLPSLSQGELP